MIRYIIACYIMLYFVIPVNAGIFDLFKLNAELKNESKKIQDGYNKEFSDIKAELGVIKNNQIKIKNDISAKVKAQIGYDKSITQDTQAGRDITITNDTGFLKAVIGAMSGVILALIGAIVLLIKMLFRYLREKKDYKRKYYEVKNNGNDKKDT